MTFLPVINEWVLPQAVTSGCFGEGAQLIHWQSDNERKGEDQFSSTVQFLEITVKVKDGSLQKFKVVLKLQGEEHFIWDVTNYKEIFQNEIHIYSEVFNTINRDGILDELLCRFYHGIAESELPFSKDFLLLEDLRPKGYQLNNEIFLDYDHLALGMKELGRFHGLSYVAKYHKPKEFHSVALKIKDKWSYEYMMKWKETFYLSAERGITPVIKKGRSVELLKKLLKDFEDVGKLYYSLVEPDEPESVICHGDCNRNNMLFQYDSEGHVKSVKFFDFQTTIYASPVLDITFFLFMNTTKETREKYFDNLMSLYKSGVAEVCSEIPVPEINFKKFGIFGYIISSYFLPFMLHETEVDMNELKDANSHDNAVLFAQYGGEKGTQANVDVIEFLLDRNYIQPPYY